MKNLWVLSLLVSMISYSQKEANIWYFGYNAGLDFSSGSPVALTNGALMTNEGCSTTCDSEGNLLFYTDGVLVWNRNHEIMPNGMDLYGHFSSSQSALIVRKPGSSTVYYIFTTPAQFAGGFNYSVVDMEADGGMGDVVEKNVPLLASCSEHLTGVVHQNGNDVWVVTHGTWNNNFHAFLITNDGVNTTPVTTAIGPELDTNTTMSAIGCMKLSPTGKNLAIAVQDQFVGLLDFDNSTGILSDYREVMGMPSYYGVEFSASGNLLYSAVTFGGAIMQYDVNAVNVAASGLQVSASPGSYGLALQLGPDRKIYCVKENTTTLTVINNPDVPGLGCTVAIDAVDLAGRTVWIGLPGFVQSLFLPAISAENFCLGETTTFSVSADPGNVVAWNFGDGQQATGTSVQHVYASAGQYTVTATIPHIAGEIVVQKIINITGIPAFTLSSNEACLENAVSIVLSPQNFNLSDVEVTWVETTTSTTGTGAVISPGIFGSFEVTVSNGECSATETITVSPLDPNLNVTIYERCSNGQYTLVANPVSSSFDPQNTYSWSGPDGFASSGAGIVITQPGSYTLVINTPEGCSQTISHTVEDFDCSRPIIPKGISPNNDNLNDNFDLTGMEVSQLRIYNRYGIEVYSYSDYTNQWQGETNNGHILPEGTYYYSIKTSRANETGWVYINRKN